METRNRKLGISARRLGFLTAMFILLSVTSAEESRRCHWCGPLAEQVHRSARAMSCDSSTMQMATCDPGYNYCATVATAPPYVESRYCVKLYQDECYPLYCNTTGSWKMACPCQGDLCNGVITEREKEAFQILAKLVTKSYNKRLKKRKTRFVRDTSNEVNSTSVNEKDGDDSSTTINDNHVNQEVTVQPTVESSMDSQTSKQTESNNNDMESTSVSLAINNNHYTIAIDGKSSDKTTKIINEETSGPVTEPLTSKYEEAGTPAIISTQATTIENSVVVVTESVKDKEIEIKQDNEIKNNQVLVDTNTNDKEIQSDEPSKDATVDEAEKKETKIDDDKKESITTVLPTTMVTDTTMMTTTKAILKTTMPTLTTKQPKNNAQFLCSMNNFSLLLIQISFFLIFY